MKDRVDPLKARLIVVMLMVIGFGAAVVGRAAFVQIWRDPRLETVARKQFQSRVLMSPRRGAILDRTGEALAINVETQSLAANPSKITNRKTLARLLSKAMDVPAGKYLEKLSGKREFSWIKRHLTENEVERLKKWRVLEPEGTPVSGLWIVKESKRIYPHGELAAHIVGSVNVDNEGLEGVELLANDKLHGSVVAVKTERDALGRPTFIDATSAQRVKDGESLNLTIDASLQYSVEQELQQAITKSNARGGVVIVMNAVNGEILAMANAPSFDPNRKGAPAEWRRNRAVTDGYEPGSTMKTILLAGALNNGFKLTDTVWGERGSFVVQGKRISEAEAHEKFEWITLRKLLQVSSNVGAAKLAMKLGPDRYLETLRSFGFGTKTKIEFPGEINGKILPRKDWQPLATANIGFGQGILVTPLQMIRAYAAIANGGWLVQPKLMQISATEKPPEAPHRILQPRVRAAMVDALTSVVEEEGGTGGKARVDGYVVAGKTGTAQEVDPATGKYSRSKFVASFIGFPVDVQPPLVIFTSIEAPRGIYYASETAAPLFSAVLNAAANRFSIPTKVEPVRKLASAEVAKEKIKDEIKLTSSKAIPIGPLAWMGNTSEGGVQWKMPALKGLTSREAIRLLQGHKFQLEVQGAGLVSSQVPEEGRALAEGDVIRLILSEP